MTSEGSLPWPKRCKTFIRAGLVVFIVFVVWLQLDYISSGESLSVLLRRNLSEPVAAKIEVQKTVTPVPTRKRTTVRSTVKVNRSLTVAEIKQKIEQINYQQVVYNEDKFGPLKNDSVVIVIQVHDRIIYLRELIKSLSLATGINRALLVFSHDFYDEKINDIIQDIDFCKVTQIFFPYSVQTHPDEFPGDNPKDCTRHMNKAQAAKAKCNYADFPDLNGHYREAKIAQTKHHWWWKANWVFDQLEITRNHNGLFLFLEEDHYVAHDFIHMLGAMERSCSKTEYKCDVYSLAEGAQISDISWSAKKVEITTWISNMGMAFNRNAWKKISACANSFCKYDDYNWDWTLQYISENCIKPKLIAMTAMGSRVFHLGQCGMHHQQSNCDPSSVTQKIQRVLKSAADKLYPNDLKVASAYIYRSNKVRRPNGGWADPRDHKLCLGSAIR